MVDIGYNCSVIGSNLQWDITESIFEAILIVLNPLTLLGARKPSVS